MNGTVRKIHPNKFSRNGNVFTRIEFVMEDDSWAKTDVCPNYRNYARWVPVLQSGPGTKLSGLVFRQKGEVNGDSFPRITGKQPDMLGEKPTEPVVASEKRTNNVTKEKPDQKSLF